MPITKPMMLVTTQDKGEFVVEAFDKETKTATLKRVDAFLKSQNPNYSSAELIHKQNDFIELKKSEGAFISLEELKSADYEIIYL